MVSAKHVLRTLILPRWKILAAGLVLIAFNRLSGLVLPGSVKFLIDRVIPDSDRELLTTIVLAVGGATLVQAVSSFLLTWLVGIEAQHLIAVLRERVQRHVIHLPVRYFDNTKSGALVSRIMTDVEGVRNLVGTGLVQLVGGLLTAAVALVILINIDPLLTAVAVLPLAVFGLIVMKAFSYVRPIFRQRGAIRADVTGRLTESLGGIRVVKGFHAEDSEKRVFADGVDRIFRNVRKTMLTNSLVMSAATLLLGLGSVLLMRMGGIRILDGRVTTGEFVSFSLYLGYLITPIVQMSAIGTQMTEAFAGLDRMEELLAEPKEGEEEGRSVELDDFRGEIAFEQVGFAYDEGTEVLRGIDLHAPAGKVVALVGSSGSGKSTLAGLAASFLGPTRGIVRVDGIDLARVKLASFRRRLAVVLQDDFLFGGTIRENIAFGRADATDADLRAAAEAAYVTEFTDRFDDGLDTLIGERGVKLSGGQRQRVSIARALLADPQLLILDEATSSLDTESEAFIQRSLAALLEGRTTFVIAHRLSTIRAADQILVLESGQIVERGTHESLLATQGRYHNLYTHQARI